MGTEKQVIDIGVSIPYNKGQVESLSRIMESDYELSDDSYYDDIDEQYFAEFLEDFGVGYEDFVTW